MYFTPHSWYRRKSHSNPSGKKHSSWTSLARFSGSPYTVSPLPSSPGTISSRVLAYEMGCFLKESHASSSARASIATDPDCSLSAVCPYSPCSVSSRSLYDSMAFCFVCRDANSQRNVPVETLMSSRAFWMVFEYCWDSRLLSSVVVEALSAASLTIRLMIRTVFADTSYGRQLIYRRGQHVGVRYVSTIA